MPSLRIFLLGTPRFVLDGRPVHIPRRKSVALLAYLARTGQPQHRDTLATLFWPEFDQSTARANLRRELSRLKNALGFEALILQGDQVRLRSGAIWLDLHEFQDKISEAARQPDQTKDLANGQPPVGAFAALSQAVELYAGDFMAGFSLPDSLGFDEWQFFQAENLRRSLAMALQRLIAHRSIERNYEQAIGYARRWLALDTLNEAAHRQLMALYAQSGQPSAALRQYLECKRILEKELAVEPEPETTQLYESIKNRRYPGEEYPGLPGGRAFPHPAPPAGGEEGRRLGQASRAAGLLAQSTRFIGRGKELAQIEALLSNDPYCRILTIAGPGGAGKTRLALEAASRVVPSFQDGVVYVPLAAIVSPDHILSALAERLDFRFYEAAEHKQQVLDYLSQKKALLILDNCEHLLQGFDLVTDILQTAADVKVLATSRERLNLSNEVVLTLRGMSFPKWEVGQPVDGDLTEYEAISFLVSSARRIQPDFTLQPEDFQPAARLCQLVEGMPLAILLATSWLELLSLAEITEEIARSQDFLESQAHDLPERQRSLRAVFNSSWSLLGERERVALERLAVFQGSFSRQAALEVAETSLASLLALVNKAWLLRNEDGRYQIHELQRQYVFEKLKADPTAWQSAKDRHGAYYTAMLSSLEGRMIGKDLPGVCSTITAEFDNIRAAWGWLVEAQQYDALVGGMLPALFRYSESRLKSFELLQLVRPALQALEASQAPAAEPRYRLILYTVLAAFYQKGDSVRLDRYDVLIPPANEDDIRLAWSLVDSTRTLLNMGFWGSLLAYLYGRFIDSGQAIQGLERMVQEFRENHQPWEMAFTLEMLGCLKLVVSYHSLQAGSILEEAGHSLADALAAFQGLGDEREVGNTLQWLGDYYYRSRQHSQAIQTWQVAEAKFEEVGNLTSMIPALLGELLFRTGNYETAFAYYKEIGEKYIRSGSKRFAAYTLSKESLEAMRYSDLDHARRTRLLSLQLSREVDDPFGEAWSLWELGEIQRLSGELAEARLSFERARVLFDEINETNGIIFYHRGSGDVALLERDYDGARAQFQKSLERSRQAGYRWGMAYALGGLGRTALALGDLNAARACLKESLEELVPAGDQGLACAILAACAEYHLAAGQAQRAIEICILVAGQYFAWAETKTGVAKTLARAQELNQSPGEPVQEMDFWGAVKEEMERSLG